MTGIGRLLPTRGRYLTAGLISSAAVVIMAGPASAATIGSGTATGVITYTRAGAHPPVGPLPACVALVATYQDTGRSGTYTVGGATYSGSMTSSFTYATFANPGGTYLDPLCQEAGPGTILPGASTTGTSNGQTLTCTYATGMFSRSGGRSTYLAVLDGACTLASASGILGEGSTLTRETRTGTLTGCTGGAPPSSCTTSESWIAENTLP